MEEGFYITAPKQNLKYLDNSFTTKELTKQELKKKLKTNRSKNPSDHGEDR